jgi:hypothetical protein
MKRTVLKVIGGTVFGLLWAALIAEIGIRALMAQGSLPSHVPADIFASQPIGWALEKNISWDITAANGIVHIRTNRQGFRDDDYPVERTSGKQRMIVLGDSFTLALETQQADTFHTRLEQLYNGSTEVISWGVSGYELAQDLLVYQYIGKDYQPDVVLLMLYIGNDLNGNLRYLRLPHYELSADHRLQLRNFPYEGEFDLPLVTTQRSTGLMKFSKLAFLVGTLVRKAPQNSASASSDFCDYWSRAHYPNITPKEWELSTALLTTLRDEVESNGGQFKVAIIPTEFQVEPSELENFLRSCSVPPHAQEHTIQEQLTAILQENGIDYLDLQPPLAERRQHSNEPFYILGNDIHLTPTGHAAVASILFAWLEMPAD